MRATIGCAPRKRLLLNPTVASARLVTAVILLASGQPEPGQPSESSRIVLRIARPSARVSRILLKSMHKRVPKKTHYLAADSLRHFQIGTHSGPSRVQEAA